MILNSAPMINRLNALKAVYPGHQEVLDRILEVINNVQVLTYPIKSQFPFNYHEPFPSALVENMRNSVEESLSEVGITFPKMGGMQRQQIYLKFHQ